MASIRMSMKAVCNFKEHANVRITNRKTGERVVGMVASITEKRKIIRTKKYSILLFINIDNLNSDFIFEQKQRIKKLDYKRKFTLDKFL